MGPQPCAERVRQTEGSVCEALLRQPPGSGLDCARRPERSEEVLLPKMSKTRKKTSALRVRFRFIRGDSQRMTLRAPSTPLRAAQKPVLDYRRDHGNRINTGRTSTVAPNLLWSRSDQLIGTFRTVGWALSQY